MTRDPKPMFCCFICFSCCFFFTPKGLKISVLSSLRFYFAHAVKGPLKGTDHMFLLLPLFEINEYFIRMNNKYAFFYRVMSALVSSLLPKLLAS